MNEESQHLKKCITRWHINLETTGKTQEVGNEIGEKLTSEEVIDELRKGGAYESKLETDPKRKIDDKIKKLNDVYKIVMAISQKLNRVSKQLFLMTKC